MKALRMLLLSAAASFAMAGPSLADTFTYTSFSVNPGLPVTLTDPSLGVNRSVEGGELTLIGSGTFQGMTVTQLEAWCLDILDTFQPTGTYNITPFASGPIGGGKPTLTANQVTGIASLMLALATDGDNPLATQLAIWRIEYGPALAFSSTNATVDADILTSATLATDAMFGGSLFNTDARLAVLDPANGQVNQVLGVPFSVSSVPEPASLVLFGSGLALLGFMKKRRSAAA